MRRSRFPVGAAMALALSLAAIMTPGQALGSTERGNHCLAPDGTDLNELLGTADAIVLPFCLEVRAGEWWLPLIRVSFAATHDEVPPGYVPSAPTPREDFLAKLKEVTYVIDEGTRHERTYTFPTNDLQMSAGSDNFEYVAWYVRMHPLPPGEHTFSATVSLESDHWDGLGLDEPNHIPAGESLATFREFVVVRGTD